MEFINNILDFLSKEMNEPVAFSGFQESWFHYLSLVLVVIAIIFLTKMFKHANQKQTKSIILVIGVILIGFEIYKQIIFSYSNDWHYRWYAFPFQFCSTVMFASLVVGLSKNKQLNETMISFLATFSLFAGIAVMFYPGDVFVDTIGINIQTMVHHGLMAALGVSLIFSKKVSLSAETLFKGLLPMAFFWMVAILLNGIVNNYYPNIGVFNMFLINPRYHTSLPILSMIQPKVSAPVFQMIYLLGITFVSYITFNLFVGMYKMKKWFVPALKTKKQNI